MLALLLPLISPVLDRVLSLIPDPEARAKAAAEAQAQMITALQQSDAAQMAANTAEGGNASLFVAGWRPGAGWVCVLALGYQYLAAPLLTWGGEAAGLHVPPLPRLDDSLWQLLTGLLGLGTLRTYEKVSGAAPARR